MQNNCEYTRLDYVYNDTTKYKDRSWRPSSKKKMSHFWLFSPSFISQNKILMNELYLYINLLNIK